MPPSVSAPGPVTDRRSRRRPRRAAVRLTLAALVVVLAPVAASASAPISIGPTTVLMTSAPPAAPVMQRRRYDYAPSVLYDAEADLYRMWWCGGVEGDYILYAESRSLSGPFHSRTNPRPRTFDVALSPHTRSRRAFDHTHTCDPSVIKVGRTWYMYYGGANEKEPGAPTRIGVATSRDGVTWRRTNRGKPIVVPARDVRTVVSGYGAGQPSVTHVDGAFYLIFTDTTGHGGNQGNGAGQYVLRSPDPLFRDRVEELQQSGFAPYTVEGHTRHSACSRRSARTGTSARR